MPDLTLFHGNKNYSSWSMRGWLALKQTGAPFREVPFDLSDPEIRSAIRRHSPTGRVPALQDGELVIWDSLAIAEYLAEGFPDARLWPAERSARAVARAVAAEMHSGFAVLRREMPFNVRRSSPGKGRAPGVQDEIDRVTTIWRDCRQRFGGRGDFLFGDWSLADTFFAPVVSRFVTYAVDVDALSRVYMDTVSSRPEIVEWRASAAAEPMVESEYDL